MSCTAQLIEDSSAETPKLSAGEEAKSAMKTPVSREAAKLQSTEFGLHTEYGSMEV